MKNILLFGECDSIYIKTYVEEILVPNDIRITIITGKNTKFNDFYAKNGVIVIDLSKALNINIAKIRVFFLIRYVLSQVKKIGLKFDILQIHYVNLLNVLFFYFISKKNKGSIKIWSYWGSDLFRASPLHLKIIRKFLKKEYKYTFCSESLKSRFIELYGKNYDLVFLDFGVTTYNRIDEKLEKNNIDLFKKEYNLPLEKRIIAIGYNGSPAQQHDIIIKELINLSIIQKNKIHLFLHFGYGCDGSYTKRIIELLEKSKITYTIYSGFLEFDEIAKLRLCVDVFINAQITDACSSSMLEYLYAGALVLNPVWLDYSILNKLGIFYVQWENCSELLKILVNEIEDFKYSNKLNCSDNRQKLYSFNSWDAVRSKWQCLLEN